MCVGGRLSFWKGAEVIEEIATDWKTLIPGEEVPIPGTMVKVTVYPLAIEHLTRFEDEIRELFVAIETTPFDPAAGAAEVGVVYAAAVLPLLTGKAIRLLNECCVPPILGAPAYVLPSVAEAWIRQTFGGDRINFWAAAAEAMVKRLTGFQSLSAYFSAVSSRQATASAASSPNDRQASAAEPSPTAAGPTLN